MKIGFVAPQEIMNEMIFFVRKEFPDVEFIPFCYCSMLELPSLLSGQQNRADAFLFLGETARRFAAKSIVPTVPWMAVPRSSSALLRLLFRAAVAGRTMHIATDWLREDLFRLAFHEIGISPEQYRLHFCPVRAYNEEILSMEANHIAELCRTGKADFCITIFYQVEKMLSARQIPVYVLQPSFEDIRAGIERLILSDQLRRSHDAPLACAALRLSIPEDQYPAEHGYDLGEASLSAARLIWQFARETGAACVEQPPWGWLLISTRSLMETATAGYHHLPLLARIRVDGPFTLSIGFGIGTSAEEAKLHAERALDRAVLRGGDQAYLMGPGLSLPVPPAQGDRLTQKAPLLPIQDQFLPLAQLSGVSVRILTLLYRACRDMDRSRFTSAELADLTGVTPRTMNRILQKLMDQNLAREVGLQFTARTGRPSRLIELCFQPRNP